MSRRNLKPFIQNLLFILAIVGGLSGATPVEASSYGALNMQASPEFLSVPEAFGKAAPANGSFVSPGDQILQWNSSAGASEYEYCFDTVNNNFCGTNWLSTSDTNAVLQDLPPRTTFYWQVRANNTEGTTDADNSGWWSFTTTCEPIVVANTNSSGPGSLMQAIGDICPGGVIRFDPSLAGQTITLASTWVINKNLTIDGSSLSPQLTISGGNAAHLEVAIGRKATLSNLTIADGYNAGNGGAIFSYGYLTLINDTLRNNHAVGSGGAIYGTGYGDMVLQNCTLSENRADGLGGAISAGRLTISDSTLSNNQASGSGGAIYAYNLTVQNTTIYQNQASGYGGAISSVGNASMKMVNSTVTQNQAGMGGGGIFMQGYPFGHIYNSTFAGNNAAAGGSEIMLMGESILRLYNTIFVCLPGNNDCYSVFFASSIAPHNSILGVGTLSDFGLEDLANNGGPTQTMALSPTSPLIDAGDDTVCANIPVNNLDQCGVTRLQGTHCDMGAFESPYFAPTPATDLGRPLLLFPPKNNSTINISMPSVAWSAVLGASSYEVVFATDSAFTAIVEMQFTQDPSAAPSAPLPDGKYYWRVRAYNDANQYGPWSALHPFTIDTLAPATPVLNFPADNASVRGVPVFRWGSVSGAVNYQFQLGDDAAFSSTVVSVVQRTPSRRPAGVLRGTYYWRVRAQDAGGNWSDWSDVFAVNIGALR